METPTRRHFLSLLASVPLLLVTRRAAAARTIAGAGHPVGEHPEPRPGIDALHVTPRDKLGDYPKAAPVFDMVREMPQIVDGIRCQCGCSEIPGNYSLLSCYEGDEPMARYCETCQGEGKLASRLFKQGKSLNDIRAAIDRQFGPQH